MAEELEGFKAKMREQKEIDSGKTEELRQQVDQLLEENKKMQRQRNELMQAFKKQMKLIDILKR